MLQIRTGVAASLLACCISCSDVQRIADASGVIRTNAESSKARFERIEGNPADPKAVQADARAGKAEQSRIIAASEKIVRALPGVKDVTPWWANLLSWALIALSVIGMVALLWMTGLGAFVKRILAAAGGIDLRVVSRPQDALAAELLDAGRDSGDTCWRMPLDEDYQDGLKSRFADFANVGGRDGGAITAACFLARFTKKYDWAHLDIAGTAWKSGTAKGASARPVPLLTRFLIARAEG